MTTATVDPGISIGKQAHEEDPTHGHLRANQDPPDKRSMEDVVSREPLPVSPESILDGDLSKIPTDMKALEALLGVSVGDKSLDTGPAHSASPAFALDDQVQAGTAVPMDETVTAPSAPAAPASAPAATATPPAVAPAAAATGSTEEAEGPIVARDGKGAIPYAVLQAERRRNAELQRQLEEARRAPTAAAAAPAAAAADGSADEGAEAAAEGEDLGGLLEELRAEFPEKLVKVVELALQRATTAEARAAAIEEVSSRSVRQNVQDVVDSDPVLSAWRDADDQTLFDMAVEEDTRLRRDPQWADRPMVERYETVKQIVSLRSGTPLPNAAPPSAPAPAAGGTPPVTTPNLAAAAAAVLQQAASKNAGRPLSLSDLPAGTPPAQSEQETAAGMSAQALEKMFSNAKDFSGIDALLARIA